MPDQKADVFFSQKNEGMLQRVLYTDIRRRMGGDLNEKQAARLLKTVKHYMGEVYRVNGNNETIQNMNTEVLQIVLPDYMMYIQRAAASSDRSAVSDIERGPPEENVRIAGAIEDGMGQRDRSQMDVGAAFSQLQSSRQNANKPKIPEVQDFRLTMENEGPVPMDIFEKMKLERDAEAQRVNEIQQKAMAASTAQGQQIYASATDEFARSRRRADQESEMAFAEMERKQLEARAAASRESQAALPEPPDMRALVLGNSKSLDRTLNRSENASAGNPTLALADRQRESMGSAQQMIIVREPSTMSYKENELNLFVYSGDRDWVSNSSETRYNFSVNFDPGNMPTGLRLSPTSTVKFRNIVRIELVKAIMPGESLDTLVSRAYTGTATFTAIFTISSNKITVTSVSSGTIVSGMTLSGGAGLTAATTITVGASGTTGTGGVGTYQVSNSTSTAGTYTLLAQQATTGTVSYSVPYNMNLLSFPYVQLNVPELDNNIYGTNQSLNASFGVLQYDANWIYDTSNTNARGYFAMIPKFLKCQKVYQPTPLATLQKLTFNFQRPDGTPLSTIPDTLDINQIYSSMMVSLTGTNYGFPYGYDSSVEANTSAAYYFLNTKTYFNENILTIGDRINIQNVVWSSATSGTTLTQLQGLITYLQGASGFLVVNVGYTSSFASGITLGANSQGYCNYIIVRGLFADPTTGATTTASMGNVADTSTPGSLVGLSSFLNSTACASGRLINQSHQVQIAMRVITREMDATSVIRPDNL